MGSPICWMRLTQLTLFLAGDCYCNSNSQTAKLVLRKTLVIFIGTLTFATTDRVASNPADKGYCQHARQHYTAPFVPKFLKTNGHAFMTHPRLCPVSAQQSVPPRQIKSKIGVRFALLNGVMHPMHIGRYNKPPENAVYTTQHAHIAMIEHGGGIQRHFEYDYTQYRRPQHDNPCRFNEHG